MLEVHAVPHRHGPERRAFLDLSEPHRRHRILPIDGRGRGRLSPGARGNFHDQDERAVMTSLVRNWAVSIGHSVARIGLRILYDELLGRFEEFRSAGPPARLLSTFVSGYKHVPITARRRDRPRRAAP
jgi:hypothetical protein